MSKEPAPLDQSRYEQTALSERSVAQNSTFVQWESQPTLFKRYPKHLFRYAFSEHEALDVIKMARFISARSTIGNSPYYRLNTPSAGNLHPLELYVHIRGIKGILSGIYHVDVLNEALVLIEELQAEGLEPFVGLDKRFTGMIFILTSVYFRSLWKYKLRAWRYLFLDAGHQLQALEDALALHEKEGRYLEPVDLKALNAIMGLEDNEHVIAVLALGKDRLKESTPLKEPLMSVQATDYAYKNATLCHWLEKTTPFKEPDKKQKVTINKERLLAALPKRRSAREFKNSALFNGDKQAIIDVLQSYQSEEISILYRSVDATSLPFVKALLDQTVVAQAGLMIFITSKAFDEQLLMQAGKIGHRVYMEATQRGLGASGIGAFYDEELNTLLETKYILYALVVGNVS